MTEVNYIWQFRVVYLGEKWLCQDISKPLKDGIMIEQPD